MSVLPLISETCQSYQETQHGRARILLYSRDGQVVHGATLMASLFAIKLLQCDQDLQNSGSRDNRKRYSQRWDDYLPLDVKPWLQSPPIASFKALGHVPARSPPMKLWRWSCIHSSACWNLEKLPGVERCIAVSMIAGVREVLRGRSCGTSPE